MLIQALCDYYDILEQAGKVLPDGYSKVKIHYLVSLTPQGEVAGIIDWQNRQTSVDKKGKVKEKLVPRDEIMLKRIETTTVYANLIEHRPLYIFGVNFEDGKFTSGGKAEKSHIDFVEKNLAFIEGIDTPMVNAYRSFVENWNPAEQCENPYLTALGKSYAGSGFAFCLAGHPEILLHREAQLKAKWEKQYAAADDNADGIAAQCAIMGEKLPIERVHSKIKGVAGGMATGTVLVGFKEAAMCSYGNEQSYNSNISKIAMEKYTQALNLLLAERNHRTVLDEVTVVHWAMSADDRYDTLCSALLMEEDDKLDADEINKILKTMMEGARAGKADIAVDDIGDRLDPDTTFYMVGIKPNSSRLAIKFIYRQNFGTLLRNIVGHQTDMRVREKGRAVPLWRIGKELVSPKSGNDAVDSSLLTKLLEAIINGTNYPPYLLATVIRRIKTDSDDKNNNYIKMNDVRIGIIKACLNRKARLAGQEEEIKMALNLENKNPAYLCGRLFAVLEKLQQGASNNTLNRTIKDSYFASAASRPAIIFPNLIKLAQHHIPKAQYGGYLNWVMGDIMSGLDGEFPDTLTLAEQGKFMIGYYQQFYAKNETTNSEEEK